ncbi:MAG: hypothetical protein HQM10_25910 [Candidatus Riflebacteria bacterium]|nr:hypothetical protein [Candidatus Riflebacteria bacterium]
MAGGHFEKYLFLLLYIFLLSGNLYSCDISIIAVISQANPSDLYSKSLFEMATTLNNTSSLIKMKKKPESLAEINKVMKA